MEGWAGDDDVLGAVEAAAEKGAFTGDPDGGVGVDGLTLGEDCDGLSGEATLAGCVADDWVEDWATEADGVGVIADANERARGVALRRGGRLLVEDRADSDAEERGVGTVGGVFLGVSGVGVLGAGGGVPREAGCIGVGTNGGEIAEGAGVDG